MAARSNRAVSAGAVAKVTDLTSQLGSPVTWGKDTLLNYDCIRQSVRSVGTASARRKE